jgi:molybdopterin synthase sulfur carrier subunit
MQVNFYATLRDIVGQKSMQIPVSKAATAGELIRELIGRYPALQHELLDEHGSLYAHVHVFVNGRDVLLLPDQLETVLQPEDVINIFPAIGGGSDEG